MDKYYFLHKAEQATSQFPDLVRTLGYSAAFEEMRVVLSQDPLLHPEDVRDIAETAAWNFLDGVHIPPEIPPNIIRGTE